MNLLEFATLSARKWGSVHPNIATEWLEIYRESHTFFTAQVPEVQRSLNLFEADWPTGNGWASGDGKETILFIKPRNRDLVSAATKRYQVFELGGRSPVDLSEGTVKLPLLYPEKLMFEALDASGEKSWVPLQVLIDELIRFLAKLRPKFVLLGPDFMYVERLVAVAAKSLNIPVVAVQHGVYSMIANPEMLEGSASDTMLVWGEMFKDLMLKTPYWSAERLMLLGYPYHLRPIVLAPSELPMPVLFAGQPWSLLSDELAEARNRVIRDIVRACQAEDVPFFYRPHYGERMEEILTFVPEASILSQTDPLWRFFERYPALYSLSSTTIFEATLYGRCGIQVYDPVFGVEDFSTLGVCDSVQSDYDSLCRQFRKHRDGTLKAHPVPDRYLHLPADLEGRFLELLEIIGDHHDRFQKGGRIENKLFEVFSTFGASSISGLPRVPAYLDLEANGGSGGLLPDAEVEFAKRDKVLAEVLEELRLEGERRREAEAIAQSLSAELAKIQQTKTFQIREKLSRLVRFFL